MNTINIIFILFIIAPIVASIVISLGLNRLPDEMKKKINKKLCFIIINEKLYFIIPIIIILIIATMFCDPTWWVNNFKGTNLWICLLTLIVSSFLFLGKAVKNKLLGLLLNKEERMSVSQLQQILWTVVILSALIAAVVLNLASGTKNTTALDIDIPSQLWYLMGITTVSLVGAPMIKNNPSMNWKLRTRSTNFFNIFHKDFCTFTGVPTVARNGNRTTITIETTPNAEEQLDLGKVQMFYLTLIVLLAYSVQIAKLFKGDTFVGFPPVDAGMVALLGISNAGYLGFKATQ